MCIVEVIPVKLASVDIQNCDMADYVEDPAIRCVADTRDGRQCRRKTRNHILPLLATREDADGRSVSYKTYYYQVIFIQGLSHTCMPIP